MKWFKVAVCIWMIGALLIWVRGPESFPLLDTLPFVDRSRHLGRDYDWAAVALILLGVWGLMRLKEKK